MQYSLLIKFTWKHFDIFSTSLIYRISITKMQWILRFLQIHIKLDWWKLMWRVELFSNWFDCPSKSFQIQCPFLTIPSQYRMNAGRVLWSFLCKLRDTLLRSNAATSAFNAFWFNKHRLVPLCCSRCAWRSKVAGHLSQDQITITAKQCFSNRFQLHTNYQHTLTEQLAASWSKQRPGVTFTTHPNTLSDDML